MTASLLATYEKLMPLGDMRGIGVVPSGGG